MRNVETSDITAPLDWRLAANPDRWHCSHCGGSKFTERLHHEPAHNELSDPILLGYVRCLCCGRDSTQLAGTMELCSCPNHHTALASCKIITHLVNS